MDNEYERVEMTRKREKDALEDQLRMTNARLERELDREKHRQEEKLEE